MQGIDPIEAREDGRALDAAAIAKAKTFREAALSYVGGKEAEWKNEKGKARARGFVPI